MGRRHPSGLSPAMHRIVALLDSVVGPLDKWVIAERACLSGAQYQLEHLLKVGLVRIDSYRPRRGRGGKPAPLYTRGEVAAIKAIHGLWPDDLAVLQGIANGKTTDEIALITGRSEFVVVACVKNILDNFGAANRAGAVAIGFRRGLLK